MTDVRFGWEAHKFAQTGTEEDSGISVEAWAEMTPQKRKEELENWLGEQVGSWSDPAIDE